MSHCRFCSGPLSRRNIEHMHEWGGQRRPLRRRRRQQQRKEAVKARQEQITAIIERDGDGYVSLCPELDIASQGSTVEEACDNFREAVELLFETADSSELDRRLRTEVYVTRPDVARG